MWQTGGKPANISQATYKVVGYDITNRILILEGEISDAYTVSPDKRYAYSDIPADDPDYALWDVTDEGWNPKEYEDEPWIEGWLTYNGNPDFEFDYDPEDSFYKDSPLFPENSESHHHVYRVPAGHFYDINYGTRLRFRVVSHDDLGCPDGENENGMFYPYYAVYNRNIDVSTFILYAHNAFTDYKMDITDVSINEVGKVGLSHDMSYINDKLTYYIDDTFRVVFRDYDTNNGIMYWMNNDNGKPDICDASIYSYNCPISVSGKSTNVAFNVDSKTLSDENRQTVLWKVLRSENANMKTMLDQLNTLAQNGYFGDNYMSDEFANAESYMASGEYAICMLKPGAIKAIVANDQNSAGYTEDDFGFFLLPLLDNQYLNIHPTGPSRFIYSGSKNIDAAKKYLEYIVKKESIQYLIDNASDVENLPIDMGQTPEYSQTTLDFLNSYDDAHSGMVLQDVVTYFNEQWMDISANIAAMFTGDMTSDEVLQAIDDGRTQLAEAAGDANWN